MERMKGAAEAISAEEIEDGLRELDPQLQLRFRELPKPLWARHFRALEDIGRAHAHDTPSDVAQYQMEYVLGVLEAREDAIVEFESKDPFFLTEQFASNERAKAFQLRLRKMLASPENILGKGQTARVKSMHVEGLEHPIAVKYLITPTAKTLSVQGEHDMLFEVEVVTSVEKNENEKGIGKYIRVPHPYFYFKRGVVQCYGMSQVNGVRLDQITDHDGSYNPVRDAVIDALQRRFDSDRERVALDRETGPFMEAVHEVCIHGDMAPKNIMVDTDGVFYLIDFGQSVSARTETEEAREQFENIRALEPQLMRESIMNALHHVRRMKVDVAA